MGKFSIQLLGDSVTNRVVEKEFRKIAHIFSRGNSNANTREALVDPEYFRPVEQAHVVLFFGGSDSTLKLEDLPEKQIALLKSWKEEIPHVTLEEFTSNLRQLVMRCREAYPSPVVYVVTPMPPHEEKRVKAMQALEKKYTENFLDITASDRTVANTAAYAAAARAVAEELKCPVIDVFAALEGNPDEYTFDGVHPNKEGNEIIADLVVKALNTEMGFVDSDSEDGWERA